VNQAFMSRKDLPCFGDVVYQVNDIFIKHLSK